MLKYVLPAGLLIPALYFKSVWIGLAAAVAAISLFFFGSGNKNSRKFGATGLLRSQEMDMKRDQVLSRVDDYLSHFGDKSRDENSSEHQKLQKKREGHYADMVNQYYDIATDFYEYGWGQSFHFAPRFVGEGFIESLRRHEYYLSSRLGLTKDKVCVDLGCGVGGPARNIARFSGAMVVGVNNNEYQIKIAKKHTERELLTDLVSFRKADFMKQPFGDSTFDCAYQIEATCHAPDLTACFKEIFRVLKPGGYFAGYEWLMADKYDAKHKNHTVIKQGIEVGNGIPNLRTSKELKSSLQKAGFEVLDMFDKTPHPAPEGTIPWYLPLAGDYTFENFRSTRLGRMATTVLTWTLETIRIAPKGTYKVQCMLTATADDLVRGGEIGVFTPAYFYLARKPQK